ncbi:MAG: hypothetical protein ACPGJI_06170 [Kangiellaceae bacterium]
MLFRILITLLLLGLLCACAQTPQLSIANECGRTVGYKDESISVDSHIVTIYSGLNWSEEKIGIILNERSNRLCTSNNYKIERNTNPITYLDGCVRTGNALGEESWKVTCQ